MDNYPQSSSNPYPQPYSQPQNLYSGLLHPDRNDYPSASPAGRRLRLAERLAVYPQSQANYIPAPDPTSTDHPSPCGTDCIFVFLVVSIGTLVLSIKTLTLKRWVEYCYLDAGLLDVSFLYSYSSYSYSDTLSYVCFILNPNLSCGDICSNLKTLEDVGGVVLVLGILSTVMQAATVPWTLVAICKPRVSQRIGRITLMTSMVLWLAATAIYIAYCASIYSDSRMMSVKEGLVFCVLVAGLQVVNYLLVSYDFRQVNW